MSQRLEDNLKKGLEEQSKMVHLDAFHQGEVGHATNEDDLWRNSGVRCRVPTSSLMLHKKIEHMYGGVSAMHTVNMMLLHNCACLYIQKEDSPWISEARGVHTKKRRHVCDKPELYAIRAYRHTAPPNVLVYTFVYAYT
jgi:hypothetical protein